jgi:2-keto-4-pentenoate hydratase
MGIDDLDDVTAASTRALYAAWLRAGSACARAATEAEDAALRAAYALAHACADELARRGRSVTGVRSDALSRPAWLDG